MNLTKEVKHHMDDHGRHYTQWNKLAPEEQALHDSPCVSYLTESDSRKHCRILVAEDWKKVKLQVPNRETARALLCNRVSVIISAYQALEILEE